jgi:hypothetical protein
MEPTMEQQAQPLNSAVRMGLTRERRREGMRVVPLEAHDTEIDGLIRCGLFPRITEVIAKPSPGQSVCCWTSSLPGAGRS